jgi:photosystem II stability/assembly factor-like uncharacterized protein
MLLQWVAGASRHNYRRVIRVRLSMSCLITSFLVALGASPSAAQPPSPSPSPSPSLFGEMHWRQIGPTRAGRARALAGVRSQPNVFYIGFDDGGVWRSTDYGANWVPIFDQEPTGSIGAIGVSQSNPNIIYVGTGAGIIRPDLATGNGVYKSTDGGKTWEHCGLDDTQMIANIDVDPADPNRLFVAALGHPYGPNAERGIFRSTDGGQTFQKVLYKDEYTSGNDVRIDPTNPNIVYAALWQQQQSFVEGGGFGGTSGGLFKSVDGGTTWTQLGGGLPSDMLEANLGMAPGSPGVLYAMIASSPPAGSTVPRLGGVIGLYKSTDAGATWRLMIHDANSKEAEAATRPDGRPMFRIGGGDLPTLAVDPKNDNVVYSSSTVLWRTDDGGLNWSAVRGSPGGDDYQKMWINPDNPNILLSVSDQGGVVSANRGLSWSNWYTQPTAAMYHVTLDFSFPYRVCAGQQDSGSGCVDSRGNDGEITFRDWRPVNIQEYGIAAPDPHNPDLVFASMRNGVSLYDRKTGQTTFVGPDMSTPTRPHPVPSPAGHPSAAAEASAPAVNYNRNVRTMPINWSPVDPGVLYYVSNAVWKSADRGHNWTRVSPDLTRQSWAVPTSAGKYAADVKPGPQGAITAFSPSPRSAKVLWAGTDDGNIQVTMDGGTTWSNVTPSAIKPWTRIFNIDAGHFDSQTAYAAANTLRVDDPNPHFWRTHDGGKTWTEINNGIAPGAVANSIREDPRMKGLLYAATNTQVWVSFDDGNRWQSLKLDMPAISVRDIELKDDSTCLCSDLVAGTHGRGFWILDDVTPLRQAAAARAATVAYLFKPEVALRVRFATNDPTPWPPEIPAGENPPPGGIIDYYLATKASGAVRLEILDAAGKVVRHYSSDDPVANPHPALDSAAYNKVCQKTPTAPDCGLPLYWPAPPFVMSTDPGMHRFNWDLRYDPIAGLDLAGGDAMGAVPRRTYPRGEAPWAPPGSYTVRLTVNGQSFSQPLVLALDPRVKASATGLARVASLSREMYDSARTAQAAYRQARALVDSVAPVPAPRRGFGFGAPAGPPPPPTLGASATALMAAAMAMQGADVAPTAREIAACEHALQQYDVALRQWTALKTMGLQGLNVKRRAAGQPAVTLPPIPEAERENPMKAGSSNESTDED